MKIYTYHATYKGAELIIKVAHTNFREARKKIRHQLKNVFNIPYKKNYITSKEIQEGSIIEASFGYFEPYE